MVGWLVVVVVAGLAGFGCADCAGCGGFGCGGFGCGGFGCGGCGVRANKKKELARIRSNFEIEQKSENHTDDFTETENKTITNTKNRVADFTVIENKRFVAAILRCGCRKIRS